MRYDPNKILEIFDDSNHQAFIVPKPPPPTPEEITAELMLREKLDRKGIERRRAILKNLLT